MSAPVETVRRLTIVDIAKLHADGGRIAMLTAYDAPTARLLDEAGIPLILVGDSVGRAMLGYDGELRVTMADMLHHTGAVTRGARQALIVADMPMLFMFHLVKTAGIDGRVAGLELNLYSFPADKLVGVNLRD